MKLYLEICELLLFLFFGPVLAWYAGFIYVDRFLKTNKIIYGIPILLFIIVSIVMIVVWLKMLIYTLHIN